MLVNQTLPGLYGGVSQQSPVVRQDSQCELQDNAYCNLVDGLIKRPNTEFVAKLNTAAGSGCLVHTIERDENERYIVLATGDATDPLEVYTAAGVKCTVKYGILNSNLAFSADATVKSYLTSGGVPLDVLRMQTVADHTIVVNSTVVCKLDTFQKPARAPRGLVYIKKGVADTTYTIKINDAVVSSFTTGHTDAPDSYKTDHIAQLLVSGFTANLTMAPTVTYGLATYRLEEQRPPYYAPGTQVSSVTLGGLLLVPGTDYTVSAFGTGSIIDIHRSYHGFGNGTPLKIYSGFPVSAATYNLTLNGSIILVERSDGADFKLEVSDSWGDAASVGIKGTVQKFNDLPSKGWQDFEITITGDDNSKFTSYHMAFDTNHGVEIGRWKETVGPLTYNIMDSDTLPHRLVRTGVNEFTFTPCLWEQRKVGDDDTAPHPSFINQTIADCVFFKNRLGFLSGENISLSRASMFFDFFPSTVLDVLDDDPIDIAVSANSVANLRYAIPFAEQLLLFAQLQQFSLSSSGGLFTPKSAGCDPTTAFSVSPNCHPVAAGANVYFTSPKGQHSSVREYYIQPQSLVQDAADITAHVPLYLPANLRAMAACNTLDLLCAWSPDEPSAIYAYKFHWAGEEKVQSAWQRWIVDGSIKGLSILGTYLYLVIKRGTEFHLEKMNLEKTQTGTLPFRVHLDSMVSLTGVYNAGTNATTWTLPYSSASANFEVINSATGAKLSTVTKDTPTMIVSPGNHSEVPFWAGQKYNMKYRFSEWKPKGDNKVAKLQGRLQTRSLTLGFSRTGYLKLTVTPSGRTPLMHVFSPFEVGVTKLDEIELRTDNERYLVMANAAGTTVDIESDSYLPVEVQTASWEGYFTVRSRQI